MNESARLPAFRWVIVTAVALILALAMGSIVNGMSAYVVPMQDLYGWDRAEISLINVSGIIGLAIGGIVMGRQADRRGARPVVLFGVIALGLSYIAASFASSLWQYYTIMFIAGFFGAAAIFSPVMATVGQWFPIGTGLAIGIASAGQALGQGGVPYLSAMLIERFGVSWSIAITGISMLVLLVPLSLLLASPNIATNSGAAQSNPDDGTYLPEKTVIVTMSIAVLFCCTCMSVPLMHLVPLVQDKGIPLDQAGGVIFIMLMSGIAGRVAFGKFADIVGAVPAYMTATAWMTVLVFWFTQLEGLITFQAYAVLYGFGYAGVMTGVLTSTSALSRPSRRASAIAIVGFFGWLGHANGGFLGGYLFDITGDYAYPYGAAAAAGVLNLIVVSTLLKKTRTPGLRVATP